MHVYMRTYTFAHVNTHTYTHKKINKFTHIHVCTNVHTRKHTRTCIYIRSQYIFRQCIYIFCIHTHICTIDTRILTHVHAHTHVHGHMRSVYIRTCALYSYFLKLLPIVLYFIKF